MAKLSAEQIFHAARGMAPEKRDGYLEGACGTDVRLRSKVDELLKADIEAGSFMAAVDPPPGPAAAAEQPGTRIDRYKLLQQIGEGGFGTVWMAEQRDPVKRLHLMQGRLDEAEAGFRRTFGDDHPATLRAIEKLAEVLAERGERAEAEKYWGEFLRARSGALGERSSQPPSPRANRLARFARDVLRSEVAGFLDEAEEAVRECLEIRNGLYPDDHPSAWARRSAASLLGGVLLAQAALDAGAAPAKLKEATPLLVESAVAAHQRGARSRAGSPARRRSRGARGPTVRGAARPGARQGARQERLRVAGAPEAPPE